MTIVPVQINLYNYCILFYEIDLLCDMCASQESYAWVRLTISSVPLFVGNEYDMFT